MEDIVISWDCGMSALHLWVSRNLPGSRGTLQQEHKGGIGKPLRAVQKGQAARLPARERISLSQSIWGAHRKAEGTEVPAPWAATAAGVDEACGC